MKKLLMLGVSSIATFAFCAVSASSSFALESTWLVSGAKPAAEVNVVSKTKGKVLLRDTGAKVDIDCSFTDTGTVGPGKLDKVLSVTANVAGCEVLEGTCKLLNVQFVSLPWLTEIVLVGGVYLDLLLPGNAGSGAPGVRIECEEFGLKVIDTCEDEHWDATLTNLEAGGVDAIFSSEPNEEEEGNCSVGGAHTGLLEGEEELTEEAGLALAVSEG